ncbi:hypothetical protein [Gilvimarinus sp. 1_MG-2023]|uniref:hypothetical protein n=1 Tax=Gilvimarinus sp. 1_MG-2023 TaxID=3062638 RepID=UPI0026E30DCF|nr:hypothetical protein [Gilvimarinus sp. 1_MG-2023]MDO6747183.1 hypothetical protein [Gilvimarinus sp. 1_MG-2023]
MASQYEIIDLIGRENFLKLARKKSGQRIYIHARLTEQSELVQLLGWEMAKVISAELGGEVVHISRDEVIRQRNWLITALRVGGYSIGELSQRFGLRERTVRMITQNVSDDEREFLSQLFEKAQKSRNGDAVVKNQIDIFEKEKL